jgi:hypothetical protein
VLRRLRDRLTYANVMSSIAVFIALGGTSYALTVPRNSVGSRQLRSHSVGTSELKTGAVSTRAIKNHGIHLTDISPATRTSLRGTAGPPGPPGPSGLTLHAIVNSAGNTSPNGVGSVPVGINGHIISFARSVAGCAYSATLAKVAGGAIEDPPPGASIIVAPSGDGVLVRTFDAADQPKGLPFHLIVAC